MKKSTFISLLLLVAVSATAKKKDHLAACWQKQVAALHGSFINFSYTENSHQLAHLTEPWESYPVNGKGNISCNGTHFLKSDSVNKWGGTYASNTQWDSATLLYMSYGAKELSKVTQSDFTDELFEEARYSPAILINYFHEHNAPPHKERGKRYAVYMLTIDKTIVKLYIRKKTGLLEKVTTMANDDLYGDVTTTISYSCFSQAGTLSYPARTEIDKINGKLKDTVTILSATISGSITPLLEKPADYKFAEEQVTKPEISVEQYNDYIHFITLHHTNGRSMVVEFDSFLLVAEAPLNSENGELIIKEAKKIAPGKPIKYFIFCHYHPDYTGGIRAFVHAGATILCTAGDMPFIQYLATAPHALQPDSLQLQPQTLHTEDVGVHKTITDGQHTMDICFIGSKSEHTKDYLLYYFPSAKMLFEGDLVYISEKGPAKKAGKRQAGLYNAIKDMKLDVTTIEQSWPVSGYGVKSEIPFTDMEAATEAK